MDSKLKNTIELYLREIIKDDVVGPVYFQFGMPIFSYDMHCKCTTDGFWSRLKDKEYGFICAEVYYDGITFLELDGERLGALWQHIKLRCNQSRHNNSGSNDTCHLVNIPVSEINLLALDKMLWECSSCGHLACNKYGFQKQTCRCGKEYRYNDRSKPGDLDDFIEWRKMAKQAVIVADLWLMVQMV